MPDTGGEQACVCRLVSVSSALSCHCVTGFVYNSSGVPVLVQQLLGRTLVCRTPVLWRDVPFTLLGVAVTL